MKNRKLAHLWPSIEMQGSQFPKIGLIHMDIQALALINVASTIKGHVN